MAGTTADTATAALAHWGRGAVRIHRLESEIDETSLITFADGDEAILKIAPAGTDPADLDFEHDLVDAALAADPTLPLAAALRTHDGSARVLVGDRWARLQRKLPGVDAASSGAETAAVARIGEVAGRMTAALAGWRHPGDGREVEWDVRRVGTLRPHVAALVDRDLAAVVERVLDDLEAQRAVIDTMPAQVVHGDLNGGNVLLDGAAVTGVVDFGDALFAPRVCDVGIALAYAHGYGRARHPWAAPAAYLAGYTRVVELAPEELALLPALARARVAQRLLRSVRRAELPAAAGRRDERARVVAAAAELRALCDARPGDAPQAPQEWTTA